MSDPACRARLDPDALRLCALSVTDAGRCRLVRRSASAALVYGLFVPGLGTTSVLLWMGLGVLLVFFGVARVTTRLIPSLSVFMSPIARWSVFLLAVLFWPFFTLPYWLLRYGAWGPGAVWKRVLAFLGGALINPLILLIVLAMWLRRALTSWEPEWPAEFPGVIPDRSTTHVGSENARRNPQRTASTAAALMIGLALVTLVATLAAGIIASFEGAVNDLWKGSDSDYAITAQNNFSPIPVDAANAAAEGSWRRRRHERPHWRGEGVRRDDLRDSRGPDCARSDRARNGRTAPRTSWRISATTAHSSTTATPTTTTSRWVARRGDLPERRDGRRFVVRGHLRPADRGIAVRQGDHLDRRPGTRRSRTRATSTPSSRWRAT